MSTSRKYNQRFWWFLNSLIAFLIGMSWGFKSTGIMMIVPSLVLIYWSINLIQIIKLSLSAFFVIYAGFFYFDAGNELYVNGAFDFLLRRVTILQGDVAWYVWTTFNSGEEFPSYWPTLLAAFGDTTLTIFGIARSNYEQWMLFHYDWMITYIAGSSLEQIAGGHSIVGTPFSEGLIAGGIIGVILFSIIGGVLIGLSYSTIRRSLFERTPMKGALMSTYFCFYIFSWLIGGAVIQLFHISLVIGFVMSIIIIKLLCLKIKFAINSKPKVI